MFKLRALESAYLFSNPGSFTYLFCECGKIGLVFVSQNIFVSQFPD